MNEASEHPTLHVTPIGEPEHALTGFCWCQPLVERDPAGDGLLYIHRRSLDSPHIEVERDPARLN